MVGSWLRLLHGLPASSASLHFGFWVSLPLLLRVLRPLRPVRSSVGRCRSWGGRTGAWMCRWCRCCRVPVGCWVWLGACCCCSPAFWVSLSSVFWSQGVAGLVQVIGLRVSCWSVGAPVPVRAVRAGRCLLGSPTVRRWPSGHAKLGTVRVGPVSHGVLGRPASGCRARVD